MTDSRPTRRDLMKPAQLLGLAFAAAVFGGVITLVSMGVFQPPRPVAEGELDPQLKAWMVAGVVAGIVFIVTLVTIALLLLAVDPAQLSKQVDRPVLIASDDEADATGSGTGPGDGSPSGPGGPGAPSPRP